MTQSRNSFVLLFLLALLQCFAPLLHAHTHGQSGVSGVHMHGDVERLLENASSPVLPRLIAERVDAPVIAMAQEYRQDSVMLLSDAGQPAPAISFPPRFSSRQPVLAASVVLESPGGASPYSQPFSQAPPPALI